VVVVNDGTILQFVMSCRVFGLGIETAALSFVVERLLAERSDALALHEVNTRNHACATFYLDHGFTMTPQAGVFLINKQTDWPKWVGRDMEVPSLGGATELPRQSS
jgi:predicted enzyme involved in methoxymalonyl-ACP biosynthesis